MRLTKLELMGFKSFARKTELLFQEGITAVIGPNGSGKSNIADAVRWVLGEQSAKALRGTRMEDVIFNGTQERRAQAYCEVLLTFDNTDGTLPLDFNEVTITRRVYRSGESEYRINRNPCRLKDIHELFRDTGIGKEGYSIIGQGRVDEILSNRSSERRTALEEAAGVTRYRARKEEALKKLDNTHKNIERLEDILAELEAQREPLKLQAEKAREYIELRDELKDLELNVFLHQYDRAGERLKSASSVIEQIEAQERALKAELSSLSDKCAGEEEALRLFEERLSGMQERLLEKTSALETRTGEVAVLRERKENIAAERARLNEALLRHERRREELGARLDALAASGSGEREALSRLDAKLLEQEEQHKALTRSIEEKEALLEDQKNSVMNDLNRLSDAKAQFSRMDAMAAALLERRAAIEAEQQAIRAEHEGLLGERQEAEAVWDALESAYKRAEGALDTCRAQIGAARQALEGRQAAVRAAEQQLDSMRSRANVLEEMSRAHEGYYASVRNVLRDSDRDPALKENVLGVVAELLSVPHSYETAVEMALGSSLQNIVTPTAEAAKHVIAHMKKRQYGRATFLPLTDIRPRTLNDRERQCLSMPGCIGVGCELVSFDPRYNAVAEYLLGRTLIVEDLEAGIAINRRTGASLRIATRAGDIINPGGSMTGGSVQKREFSILGREREVKQLLQAIRGQQTKLSEQTTLRLNSENDLKRLKEDAAAMEARLNEQRIAHARQKEKRDLIERDLQLNLKKQQQYAQEREQIEDTLQDIGKERAMAERLLAGIEQGSAATKEDVLDTQRELSALRKQGEELTAILTEHKVRRMAVKKEEDALDNERRRTERELEDTRSMEAETRAQLSSSHAREAELVGQIDAGNQALSKLQEDVEASRLQLREAEAKKQRLSLNLSDERKSKDACNEQMRDLEERRHKHQLQHSRAELELTAIQERILADYNMAYEDALPYRRQAFGVTAAHVRIDEVRKHIRELGSINVNAVEDFAALRERLEMLETQCADLTKARVDLNRLIDELTQTMERQFLGQFAIIQENFKTVFAQLFEGGHAELRLADSKDALNCEIDIIAQPPGKKLQLLTLLSGGERALTAIALLFAMLKLKPTVFCILDEIESSLDEVNVARFANYLKNYSDDTQFILITHRKGSMEASNALYGVAMEERGVSRLVSAHFTSNSSLFEKEKEQEKAERPYMTG